MSFYYNWNFTDNPFSAQPLRADETGNNLLIGRESEIKIVLSRLKSGGPSVSLDGPIGVGKTSLANVAAYRAQQDFLSDPIKNPLILPCRTIFQIISNENPEDFKMRVLIEVAQTLIEKSLYFKGHPKLIESNSVRSWLNSPMIIGGGIQILSCGPSIDKSTNDSLGFQKSGFPKLITEWLSSVFPDQNTGGVVCIIDNLELLETSAIARKTIESLRDTLFTIPGIRWILCGAHGIINSVVSSQRLIGIIGKPIPIAPLKLTDSSTVFTKRIEKFKDKTKSASYIPLKSENFHKTYLIVNNNLRQTLAYCHDYCQDIDDSGNLPKEDKEKFERFEGWLISYSKSINDSVKTQLTPRAYKLFKDCISSEKINGEFSPSDFEILGFKKLQAMRPHVKLLEDLDLLVSEKDDDDHRRKTITVTGKGRFLYWYGTVKNT